MPPATSLRKARPLTRTGGLRRRLPNAAVGTLTLGRHQKGLSSIPEQGELPGLRTQSMTRPHEIKAISAEPQGAAPASSAADGEASGSSATASAEISEIRTSQAGARLSNPFQHPAGSSPTERAPHSRPGSRCDSCAPRSPLLPLDAKRLSRNVKLKPTPFTSR
jgi:hypothetical protein